MAPITLATSFINSLSSLMLIVVPISHIIIYKWSHWDRIKSTSTHNTDFKCLLFFVPKPASFSLNGLSSSPHTKLFWFSCIFSVTFQSITLCVRFSNLLSLLVIYWVVKVSFCCRNLFVIISFGLTSTSIKLFVWLVLTKVFHSLAYFGIYSRFIVFWEELFYM